MLNGRTGQESLTEFARANRIATADQSLTHVILGFVGNTYLLSILCSIMEDLHTYEIIVILQAKENDLRDVEQQFS